MARPSPQVVERRLRQLYGQPRHHNKRDPLAELVFILLSARTREVGYRGTFTVMWKTYRSWERVRRADAGELEALIRFGGFARRKVGLLQKLLERVRADRGTTSLRWLARLPTADVLAYLVTLPGVGLKTARCVAMYALERPVLAVDTHVWRIAKRLGWVDGGKHPDDRRSEQLEATIPPGLRYSLHVTLVAHDEPQSLQHGQHGPRVRERRRRRQLGILGLQQGRHAVCDRSDGLVALRHSHHHRPRFTSSSAGNPWSGTGRTRSGSGAGARSGGSSHSGSRSGRSPRSWWRMARARTSARSDGTALPTWRWTDIRSPTTLTSSGNVWRRHSSRVLSRRFRQWNGPTAGPG